jgi:ribosomal protein S18 acetylase RimI-like enzyme
MRPAQLVAAPEGGHLPAESIPFPGRSSPDVVGTARPADAERRRRSWSLSEFAEYAPRSESPLPPVAGLVVRPAESSDLPAVAPIAAAREGQPVADCLRSLRKVHRAARDGESLLLVAAAGGDIIGYAKAGYVPAAPAPKRLSAPAGWYLTGVVVRPEFRRRGVASELTRARLDWISRRSGEAHYIANARNLASLDLHRRFGFVELFLDVVFPGVEFEGGRGILCRCRLDPGAVASP